MIKSNFYISVFGLGTLIFTGLEIAMHATMEKNCVENILIAHPILQALFTFLQMHFLFVNSQVINKRNTSLVLPQFFAQWVIDYRNWAENILRQMITGLTQLW